MSAEYTGLHGRSPYEQPYHGRGKGLKGHFVPEGWEDLDRGICPGCGHVVSWDAGNEIWRVRRNFNVLVLSDRETDELVGLLGTFHGSNTDRLALLIGRMKDLNKPYVEVDHIKP